MARARDIARIRKLLQKRRRNLLLTAQATTDEVDGLKAQDRDPELEENAQVDLADYTLTSLVETHRRELSLIDAALARIDLGIFGECVDCGAEIALERLLVLPFAIRCEECAVEHEQRTHRYGPAEAAPTL